MKKTVLIFLSLLLIISFGIPAYAEGAPSDEREEISVSIPEEFESVNISEEEKEIYANSTNDTVIKIFARCNFLSFARSKEQVIQYLQRSYHILPEDFEEAMQELVGRSSFPVTYYASIPDTWGIEPVYTLAPVETFWQPSFENYGDWRLIYNYAKNPSLIFGDEVDVYRVCCISEAYGLHQMGAYIDEGHQSRIGMYIYYETSIGDYVLFCEQSYANSGNTYLFSADEFFTYSQMCRDYDTWDEEWENTVGGAKTFPLPEYFGFTSHSIDAFRKKMNDAMKKKDSLYEFDWNKRIYTLQIFCNGAFFDGSLSGQAIEDIAFMPFLGASGDNNRVTRMYYDPSASSDYYRYDMHSYSTYCAVSKNKISWKNQSIWDGLYDYAVKPSLIFGDEVEVQNVYCFNADYKEFYDPTGFEYGHDCAIYYVTDYGDYVLYTPNTNEANGPVGALYMFPVDAFYEYTSALGAHVAAERAQGVTEYTRPSPEAFGFTSYALDSFVTPPEVTPEEPSAPAAPETPPVGEAPTTETPEGSFAYIWIPIAVAGAAVIGIAAFILVRKKRAK